jgi:hypothetical protein
VTPNSGTTYGFLRLTLMATTSRWTECATWVDMHGKSCEHVLDADFDQAWAALQQGATLVRIHQG